MGVTASITRGRARAVTQPIVGFGDLTVRSASAEAISATEITFTLSTSYAYAGVEWGVDPDYTWATFLPLQASSHSITIDAADGVVASTTYAWRAYVTNDPLDDGDNRVYGPSGTVATPSAYSDEALAVINAYASTPSDARKTLIAALVDGLIADGVWTSLDSLYVTAAPAEADTLVNWKNPGTNNLTKTGTVTHAADVSMTGNGTTGRLTCSTKFNDAGFGWAQNSAHIMVWTTGTRTNAFTCGSDDTITNSARVVLTADNSFDSATFRINTPNSSAGKATTAATGMFLAQRTAAAVSQAYQNGAAIGTADTDASVGECDGKFTLCAGYTTAWAYSSTGIKAGSFGPSLTGTQITALYNRLNTYLGAI